MVFLPSVLSVKTFPLPFFWPSIDSISFPFSWPFNCNLSFHSSWFSVTTIPTSSWLFDGNISFSPSWQPFLPFILAFYLQPFFWTKAVSDTVRQWTTLFVERPCHTGSVKYTLGNTYTKLIVRYIFVLSSMNIFILSLIQTGENVVKTSDGT